jgi:hypothetical protein
VSDEGLLGRLDGLAADAARIVAGTALAADVEGVRARLHRPLRVAIAGRTKAGKSTLLNALVGERLAATDATECTRLVTWYRYDLGYSVAVQLRTGERGNLEFDRSNGLEIRLGGYDLDEVERLEVGWPSARLTNVTLIDTPGIDAGATDPTTRTVTALVDDEGAGEADAVIYLMRHLHERDAAFLEAFDAQSAASGSPVNAVALLSRADEIGGGRLDALESSARVANRYSADPRVATLVMAVLPICGLLAETGASLRESELAWLRQVATLEQPTVDALLLSVDRFRSRDENPLPAEAREHLLNRFGLFGLRRSVAALRERPDLSASELSRLLVDASGIRAVEGLIRRHFADRADALKARTALARLRSVATRAAAAGLAGADDLAAGVERLEASSPELGHLRLLHLVHARLADLNDGERAEVDRLLGPGSLAERVGEPVGTAVPRLREVTLGSIERWRVRASQPMLDRRTTEAAEAVARAYEGIHQQLSGLAARG